MEILVPIQVFSRSLVLPIFNNSSFRLSSVLLLKNRNTAEKIAGFLFESRQSLEFNFEAVADENCIRVRKSCIFLYFAPKSKRVEKLNVFLHNFKVLLSVFSTAKYTKKKIHTKWKMKKKKVTFIPPKEWNLLKAFCFLTVFSSVTYQLFFSALLFAVSYVWIFDLLFHVNCCLAPNQLQNSK